MNQNNKLIKLIGTNLIILVLLILSTEFLLRVFLPEIQLPGTQSTLFEQNRYSNSTGLKPGSKGLSNGIARTVDDLGFWQFRKSFNPDYDSWLILGDSVTMGLGVKADSTFAGLLNNYIDSLNVLNSAVIGYYSNDYLNVCNNLFRSDERNLKIKRAIIFWCLNDIYENFPTQNLRGHWLRNQLGTFLVFVRTNFKTFHLIKNLFLDRSKAYFQYDSAFYINENELLNKSVEHIREIVQVARENNVQFELFILPYEFQIRNRSQKNIFNPQEILKQKLSSLELKIYDCTQAFTRFVNESETLYLYGDGIHFSNRGHREIADFVFKTLINEPLD